MLDSYGWHGHAVLKASDRTFMVIHNWVVDKQTGQKSLDRVIFGKEIVKTLRGSLCMIKSDDKVSFCSRYSLKNRIYLGPTSTDHELAFLMVGI